MANWKYRLSVGRDRRDYDDGLISLQELGKRIADKIKTLPCYGKDESMFSSSNELGDCALEFENVIDVEDFDNILEALYDWADTEITPFDAWPRNKMCWVEPTARALPVTETRQTLALSREKENQIL